ncbi:MAG: hypothetical protein V1875_07350 [Candidatus Altiarchaeota archaeon]
MNSIAHILLSYLIGRQFTDEPLILAVCVFWGILPDLDHIPHLSRALSTGRFGPESRSRFHELYGLSALSASFSVVLLFRPSLYFLYFPLLAHYLLDFLTRPTRPLYPYEGSQQFGHIYPRSLKRMTVADVLVTLALAFGVMLT